MAKSTFLQLCQAAASECGLSGSLNTVVGQSGAFKRIVDAVANGDVETQGRWLDWDFLHVATWNASTVIGTADVSAPTGIGAWDVDSFYLDYNTATFSKLTPLDYADWRKNWRQGIKTNQRPTHVAIKPDLSLTLESPPNAVYLLTADHWLKPVKMAADTDTSLIPEEYERIIIARAKISYAEFEAASEIMSNSTVEYDDLLDKLEGKYLPNRIGRRAADATTLVVRPV